MTKNELIALGYHVRVTDSGKVQYQGFHFRENKERAKWTDLYDIGGNLVGRLHTVPYDEVVDEKKV